MMRATLVKQSKYSSSYWLDKSFLFMEVHQDFLERLGIYFTAGFMFLYQLLPEYEAIGYFTFWVIFYPCLVPLAPVVSLFIHFICLFFPLLRINFLPGGLVVLFLIGGIILVPFWIWLFGIIPVTELFLLKALDKLRFLSSILSSYFDRAVICSTSGKFSIQFSFMQIFLYLFSSKSINLYLSMPYPSPYLSFWCCVYLINYLSPETRYPLKSLYIMTPNLYTLVVRYA